MTFPGVSLRIFPEFLQKYLYIASFNFYCDFSGIPVEIVVKIFAGNSPGMHARFSQAIFDGILPEIAPGIPPDRFSEIPLWVSGWKFI